MWQLFLFVFICLVLLILTIMTYRMAGIQSRRKLLEQEESEAAFVSHTKGLLYVGIVISIALLLFLVFKSLEGSVYEAYFSQWLDIIVRWMHITFGIAWIGTSFYFVFLENALNRTKDVRNELAGNLWAVHGGGFYYLEKYKVAPKLIPKELHWFKYEAYFTWISGFSLLFIVYYFNAQSQLIDPNILDISSLEGIAIGVGSLVLAWLIYDLLCKSPLSKQPALFALLGFALCVAFAYFYTRVFSGGAAYIHFGAMIGTLMAGNVFFVIIPSQKTMVNLAKKGQSPDPEIGKHAGLRSLHNNYLTLPVLFVMISNHFPSTFAHEHNWAILAAISLGSAGVKHYLNLREKGRHSVWVLPVSILLILGVAFLSAPEDPTKACDKKVSFVQIYSIINTRCISCHSARPMDETLTEPPNGVTYDTPLDVVKKVDEIMQRVVLTNNMPQNNKTNITPEERQLIGCWISQGASIE